MNHSKDFIDRKSAACTNGIGSDWRHAKVMMPQYGVHRGMHVGYLAEFMWRQIHMEDDKFITLIKDINSAFQKKYLYSLPNSSN